MTARKDCHLRVFAKITPNVLRLCVRWGFPALKPIELFECLIKTYTNEGDLVLDNTAGSGTTAIACLNTNRKFIVMEKEEKYFEIIKNRTNGKL